MEVLGMAILMFFIMRALENSNTNKAIQALVDEATEPGILARRAWAAREAEAAKAYAREKTAKLRAQRQDARMTGWRKTFWLSAAWGILGVWLVLIVAITVFGIGT
jgi:hypothetical protein